MLLLLIVAKLFNAYSFLSKLVNNTLLLAFKLLFLLLSLSQPFLRLMPGTWHALKLLLKRKNAAGLKVNAFIMVKPVTKPFSALLSQPINMSRPFKSLKTPQLLSLLQTLLRTGEKVIAEQKSIQEQDFSISYIRYLVYNSK